MVSTSGSETSLCAGCWQVSSLDTQTLTMLPNGCCGINTCTMEDCVQWTRCYRGQNWEEKLGRGSPELLAADPSTYLSPWWHWVAAPTFPIHLHDIDKCGFWRCSICQHCLCPMFLGLFQIYQFCPTPWWKPPRWSIPRSGVFTEGLQFPHDIFTLGKRVHRNDHHISLNQYND